VSAILPAARIAWRTMPESLDRRTAVVRLVVVPVLTSLFYLALTSGGGARSVGPDDAVAAAVGSGAVVTVVSVAALVAGDRFNGTLPHVFVASHARATAWASRFAVVAGLGTVASTVSLMVLMAVTGLPTGAHGHLALVVVLICTAPASVGIGWLLGGLSLNFRDPLALANIAEYVLPLGCGVVVSVSHMPEPVAWSARVVPVTHVLEAGRVGAVQGLVDEFWSSLGVGLAEAIAWAVLGWVAWRVLQRRARRIGAVDGLSVG